MRNFLHVETFVMVCRVEIVRGWQGRADLTLVVCGECVVCGSIGRFLIQVQAQFLIRRER
jgi:hypothetical protein